MKLDGETRRKMELHTTGDGVQAMVSMRQFLEERARAIDRHDSRNKYNICSEQVLNARIIRT